MYAFFFFYPLRATTPCSLHINIVCIYVCMVITYTSSRSCSWSAEHGKLIFPGPRSRLRIWSPRETGSAVPSHVSLLILYNRTESGAYSRDSCRVPRWLPFIYSNHLTPLVQSRVYRVAQLPIDGVSLPRVRRHRASSLQDSCSNGRCLCIIMDQLMWVSPFPHPLLV